MKPTFFESPAKFRKWLAKNHDKVAAAFCGRQLPRIRRMKAAVTRRQNAGAPYEASRSRIPTTSAVKSFSTRLAVSITS